MQRISSVVRPAAAPLHSSCGWDPPPVQVDGSAFCLLAAGGRIVLYFPSLRLRWSISSLRNPDLMTERMRVPG